MILSKNLINFSTIERLGEGQFDHPCEVSKSVSFRERVKTWLFVTLNIIVSHIFSENSIEIDLFVQRI